jgi:transcriptional regulator with PAS, ATPase and Fis domain
MGDICYAAYNEDFIPLAKKIFNEMEKDVQIKIYNRENPEALLENGAKVFLARGGTAKRIRTNLNVPVVEIPIPFEDIIEALSKASIQGKNIGVIGYDNLLQGLELLNPLLNINIRQEFAKDEVEMRSQILNLKNEGINVLVGGAAQTRIAKEFNIPYVRIDFSEKALRYAYYEASLILKTIVSNIRKNEELNAILNNTKEGYIAIDRLGKITLINETALSRIPEYKDPVGMEFTDVFPELKALLDVLKTGKESLQEISHLKGMTILYNMIPLKADTKEIVGAIITFNDTKTITKAEYKIRDNILNKGLYATYVFENIKGETKAMKECKNIGEKFAVTDSTVLIVGETGVGKELFAQSIHNASPRKSGPFVAINCASLSESILESELFGYEEGAFTGAKKGGKIGLFELAHKGTIFLDEISEMPVRLQGRFLRVLQERKVMRLGSDQVIPIDVRILAATNKKMRDLVKENKFREDLFYRLNVLTLVVPPLRERKADITGLAKEFILRHSKETSIKLTTDGLKALQDYPWPGNVRQLQNFIEKINIIHAGELIDGATIEEMIERYEPTEKPLEIKELNYMHSEITKGELEEALNLFKGKRVEAANYLGIHRSTLWRLMKKFNI